MNCSLRSRTALASVIAGAGAQTRRVRDREGDDEGRHTGSLWLPFRSLNPQRHRWAGRQRCHDRAASRAAVTSWGTSGHPTARAGTWDGAHRGHDVSDGASDEEDGRPQQAPQVFLRGPHRRLHQPLVQGEQGGLPVRPRPGVGPCDLPQPAPCSARAGPQHRDTPPPRTAPPFLTAGAPRGRCVHSEEYGLSHGKVKTVWKTECVPSSTMSGTFKLGIRGSAGPRDRRELSSVNTQGGETPTEMNTHSGDLKFQLMFLLLHVVSNHRGTFQLDHEDKRKSTESPTQPGALPASVTAGGDLGGAESGRL